MTRRRRRTSVASRRVVFLAGDVRSVVGE